eukprot:TRINITY_DN9245_c0_g1_i1.p1 TRINITY_DN9245_c0_g1~~TRINITY_DN9245_c0_g1_i1.p1  ORF type:complete len:479 (+),score=130.95 TRINITY_DN9245_c0_g1_i1:49-1437(+)
MAQDVPGMLSPDELTTVECPLCSRPFPAAVVHSHVELCRRPAVERSAAAAAARLRREAELEETMKETAAVLHGDGKSPGATVLCPFCCVPVLQQMALEHTDRCMNATRVPRAPRVDPTPSQRPRPGVEFTLRPEQPCPAHPRGPPPRNCRYCGPHVCTVVDEVSTSGVNVEWNQTGYTAHLPATSRVTLEWWLGGGMATVRKECFENAISLSTSVADTIAVLTAALDDLQVNLSDWRAPNSQNLLHLTARRGSADLVSLGSASEHELRQGLPWCTLVRIAAFAPSKMMVTCRAARRDILCNDAAVLASALLRAPFSVPGDAADEIGWTPLHWAAWVGNLPLCQVLLQHSTRALALQGKGGAPLHIAACRPCAAIVELFLASGASATAANSMGMTPMEVLRLLPDTTDEWAECAELLAEALGEDDAPAPAAEAADPFPRLQSLASAAEGWSPVSIGTLPSWDS